MPIYDFLLLHQIQLQNIATTDKLCTTTTLGIPNLCPLLTGGSCSDVDL